VKIKESIKEWVKSLSAAALILLLLKVTGLLGGVSYVAQSALLKTGLMDASSQEIQEGEILNYNFSIKDLDDTQIDFKQYKGKVVFINLWATWCAPCRAEMNNIQKLYDKTDHEKIKFVMLSFDKETERESVSRFLKKNSYTFPVFMPSEYLSPQLNSPSIPTTFVISKEGKIVAKEVGTTNYNTSKFKKFLEQLAN
jgi:thiol-disulfide isomerase/thioredoxin